MLAGLYRYRTLLSYGFFLLLALFLATVNFRSAYRLDPVGIVFLEIMYPFQVGATALARGVKNVWAEYRELLSVYETNQILRARLTALEQMQRGMVELERSNRRLERLLELRGQSSGVRTAARVIGRNSAPGTHTAVLDKGARHGIREGMAVLTAAGVVGRVVATSPHAAHILLISAANSGVDALVQRSRIPGIVSGSLTGRCRLKYVQRGSDVQVGDAIVTSGLDGVFPKGQHIGRVTRITTRDDEMFHDIEVVLSAEFARVEEVLVVASAAVRASAD